MTGNKCKSCGSAELEVDTARGDTVCTNCGTVLEDSVIVSEVQFEENAHGGSSALGQFVSSESKGGCRGFGSNFHSGLAKESREITLQNAKRGISNLCQQLRLNQHCIDTAYNFYKLALTRQLTRGRKNPQVLAACVYITCRIEGTPHLLIDFSEVLQIDAFELGKTYLRLSQALCIKIPSMDPCLYVLRYANKLEFGEKTHEVAMTALRLVQRMKKDSIHSGRHPSGLCGAALLMAARLHEFNRSVNNIIQIVNIHESTLKKRLFEFGETLSSTLTPEEFLSVDLEEEQDPPSYKAARLKDKERLHKLMEDEQSGLQLSELQQEIERQLDMRQQKKKKRKKTDLADDSNNVDQIEEQDTNKFVLSSTVEVIEECLESSSNENNPGNSNTGIGPSMESLGLEPSSSQQQTSASAAPINESEEFDLEGLDDDEINSYIMTPTEASKKHVLWLSVNANYLKDLREKEEKLAKAREEGKPEKKKRKYNTKKNKNIGPSNSAGEAIKKMLQEKKISSKINYDVLKSLNVSIENEDKNKTQESSMKQENSSTILKSEPKSTTTTTNAGKQPNNTSSVVSQESNVIKQSSVQETEGRVVGEDNEIAAELEEYEEEEGEGEVETEGQISLSQMLNQHRDDDEYYGSYDDYDY